MKPYHNVDVELRFQNCGSWWLMVLEGAEQDIELVFNGLWNHGAIDVSVERSDGTIYNGLDYTDHTRTKATFWSTPEKMYAFFFNRHMLIHGQRSAKASAHVIARMRIEELKLDSVSFHDFNRPAFVSCFTVGTIKAERPDDNYREKATLNANKRASEKTVDKD